MLGERRAAEDQTQEAFIRAYQRLDRFDPQRPFGPWIRRVAANLCLNTLERRQPPGLALDDERDVPLAAPEQDDPAAAREETEAAAEVRAAILDLPPRYRAVIELRHFQELSYDEIAAALHLPLSDVKSHLFRARRLLAQTLGPLR
jgi:RNA polymerase sigma-70 factor (ECF subfamily)